ncbi:50S ribosomal protein L13, partial [Candidatus Uhrbacteria bacterium RIFCSPHIGHO2_02_FULL_54_11]
IDASGKGIGRLATRIATLLQGKHKPTYVPHIDAGDFVEVVNLSGLSVSQKKADEKIYIRHTMHPGGLKGAFLKDVLKNRPEHVLELAVSRMLPKNKLRTDRMKRLTFKKEL